VASERQSPDAILASTNLTGSVSDIQDDPDSPDANWLTATSPQVDTALRVSFPTPTGDPITGAGLQEFRWWVRHNSQPGGSDPTYVVHLYENGSDLGQIASGSIASGTGEIISATWDAVSLGTSDGSLVEAYIYGTVVKKSTVEIGAVEWNVTYDAAEVVVELSGTSAGAASVTSALNVVRRLIGTSAGTSTATSVLKVVRRLIGISAGVATATGALTTSITRELSGTTAGTASVSGAIRVLRALVGATAGVASVTGIFTIIRGLTGTSAGATSVTGTLAVDMVLAGASAGCATATGSLTTSQANNDRFGAMKSDLPLGSPWGEGLPTHVAGKGTFYFDVANRHLYLNHDGGTGWTLIGGGLP